jgi:uncharacterized protein (DUF2236 family)
MPDDAPTTPRPLGPDSLTWRYFGDGRGIFLTLRAGVLQAMHPTIGQALVDHSDVFENQWGRLLRSIPPILDVVYGADPGRVGATVRDYHRDIRGRHGDGTGYHALSPDAYYWAHATFFESQIATQDLFGRPLSRATKEQLYRESIDWYALYGLSMRPVPPDYAAFEEYWHDTVQHVLEPTEPVRWTFTMNPAEHPSPLPALPERHWRYLRTPVVGGGRWVARGTLPPVVRERLGLAWTASDERRLRALRAGVRGTFAVLPEDWRYGPTPAEARRRVGLSRPKKGPGRMARFAPPPPRSEARAGSSSATG